jgi:HEAT repeat protein
MNDAREYVSYYVKQLREGRHGDAYFSLIEGGPIVPLLIEAFGKDENRGIRADIVRCIWQHRRLESISFLAEVLHDPEPAVWQEALDGLVALGGREVTTTLQEARKRVPVSGPARGITVEWIDEALDQL